MIRMVPEKELRAGDVVRLLGRWCRVTSITPYKGPLDGCLGIADTAPGIGFSLWDGTEIETECGPDDTRGWTPRERPALPGHLIAAYDWIDNAGEWTEALANPEKYASAASLRAVATETTWVTRTDLLEVIAWKRALPQ